MMYLSRGWYCSICMKAIPDSELAELVTLAACDLACRSSNGPSSMVHAECGLAYLHELDVKAGLV